MKPNTQCGRCAKGIYKSPCVIAAGKPLYCSRTCAAKSQERHKVPLEERFWKKVNKTHSCWLWTGSLTGAPGRPKYGGFRVTETRTIRAHRYSWELHYGKIPKGLLVCHSCDVRLCVNPDHLFLGTNAINIADRDAKGRTRAPKGMENGHAVLTDDDVRGIRAAIGVQAEIAARFGTHQSAVSRIRAGKAWAHVH